MNSSLLITKIIIPSRRTDALRRPRLLDFLHEYIERKLLLISASAGYGKTSLLIDFAHDTQLPVCWYSLDQGDHDPQVFLEYLVAAIQRRFPNFGGRTTALLRNADDSRTLDACIGSLITEIHEQIDSFFVIVLDDYHLVESSQPVNQILDRLLLFLPENAHLILSSRTIPVYLTLTRLTALMQVAGLGASDLRFTSDEIRALVQQNYGMEVTPAIADELAEQSEGWITGIVLTTPTVWRGLFQEWVKGYGPGNQLFEYLAVEVLAQQPPELQQFLLDTSVLTEMDDITCNELLGRSDAQSLLQLAEKRNLFLLRLEEQGYRYHHLFREFLSSRLQQTQPARYRNLMRQAAALLERRGKIDRAIKQWFDAGEPAQAARLIEILIDHYYKLGRWATLAKWLDALPETVLRDAPQLLLWHAIISVEMGSADVAQQLFAKAIAEFERLDDVPNLARALIESARHEIQLDAAIGRCERALSLVPQHEYPIHALGYRTIGTQMAKHGDFGRAIPLLERAAKLYEIANQRSEQSDAENDLGGVYLMTGDRVRAMKHFETARTFRRRVGNSVKLANTLNMIAVACYQRGELLAAVDLLQEALSHAQRSGHLRVEGYVLSSLGDIYRDQQKLADALQAYTQASTIAEKIREPFLLTYTRVAVGDVWRLVGDLETTEQVLQSALQAASAHRSDYEVALVQIAIGALRLAQKEPEPAERHLELALSLLEGTASTRDLGRTYFYLADAALQSERDADAVPHLRALAELGKKLDEDQFLVSQAAYARHVLTFAIASRVGGSYFKQLANKLGQSQDASSPLLVRDSLPQLELYTLGEARLVMDGVAVPRSAWQTVTTKELFFYFVTNPQGWRKEQIFEALWSHMSRSQANDLFHASMYRIRRALFAECIVFRNGLYQLHPEVVFWLDTQEFEQECAAARDAELLDQIELLERAISLYHGEFLHEFYSDWCIRPREQMQARYLEALAQLGRAWSKAGNPKRALDLYRQILQLEPAREETHRDLIELYLATGNRTGAIQAYHQCLKALDEELGVRPMPETVALYDRLLRES